MFRRSFWICGMGLGANSKTMIFPPNRRHRYISASLLYGIFVAESPFCAGYGVRRKVLCFELGVFHVVFEEGCFMEEIFFCGFLFSYFQHVVADVCYCCVFASFLEEFEGDICGTSCGVPEGFVGEWGEV